MSRDEETSIKKHQSSRYQSSLLDKLRKLIEEGGNLDKIYTTLKEANSEEVTPELYSKILGHSCRLLDWNPEIANFCIQHGADINAEVLPPKQRVIHCALMGGQIDAVKFLIDNKVDLTFQDLYSWNPLHLACQHRSFEMVKLLLLNGANPNTPNPNGDTPLNIACEGKRYDVVRLLMDHGADAKIKGYLKRTPLHNICSNLDGREIDSKDTAESIAGLLMDHVSDIDAADRYGNTPLHLAFENHNGIEVKKLLIEKGAKIHATNLRGHTPLHSAFAFPEQHPSWLTGLLEKKDLRIPQPMNFLQGVNHLSKKFTFSIDAVKRRLGSVLIFFERDITDEELNWAQEREVFTSDEAGIDRFSKVATSLVGCNSDWRVWGGIKKSLLSIASNLTEKVSDNIELTKLLSESIEEINQHTPKVPNLEYLAGAEVVTSILDHKTSDPDRSSSFSPDSLVGAVESTRLLPKQLVTYIENEFTNNSTSRLMQNRAKQRQRERANCTHEMPTKVSR